MNQTPFFVHSVKRLSTTVKPSSFSETSAFLDFHGLEMSKNGFEDLHQPSTAGESQLRSRRSQNEPGEKGNNQKPALERPPSTVLLKDESDGPSKTKLTAVVDRRIRDQCPACQIGILREEKPLPLGQSIFRVTMAILCFPCGMVCLFFKQEKCSYCGMSF